MAIYTLGKEVYNKPIIARRNQKQFIEEFKKSKQYDSEKDYAIVIESWKPDDDVQVEYWTAYEVSK